MNILELTEKYRKGELSPVDAVASCLGEIEATEQLHYFTAVNTEAAMAQATESEKRYKNGAWLGPLDGVPYSAKDLIFTEDLPSSAGSAIYQGYNPGFNAECISRLKQSGAILMGKANMQEMAFGAMGDISYIGWAKNPYNPSMVCGGSSSGSAGAVAKGLVCFSLATDTGGSIRIPSALCGVYGLKPTHGRTSIRGIMPVCEELDHLGIIAGCAEDCALVLDAISRFDPEDSFCIDAPRPESYASSIGKSICGIKAAVAREYIRASCQPFVSEIFDRALAAFVRLGGIVEERDFPEDFESFRPLHQKLLLANAWKVHKSDYEQHGDLISPEIVSRLETGNIPVNEYITAMHTQENFRRVTREYMAPVDVLIIPTVPDTAVRPFTREIEILGSTDSAASVYTRYTWFSNYSGFPAISVPIGFHKGLPIGLQIVAKEWEEEKLLMVASAFGKELR